MASYRGRLDVLNRPYRGVLVAIYNTNGVKIDVETSDRYGFYRFTGLATGSYTVKFRGRNYSNQDDIDITVVDSFDSEALAPLTFFNEPTLGVSEGDPYVSTQGEGSEAILALSHLQAETGVLGWVDLWYQKTTSPSWSDYQMLVSVTLGGPIPGYDDEGGILNTKTNIALIEKPVLYDFKAIFFNPSGDPAMDNALEVEVHELNVSFNGVPDLDEYIGVTDVDVLNSNLAGTAIPTNEIVASWTDMRVQSTGTYINAAGEEINVAHNQLATIASYVIYMFVSNSTLGPSGGDNYPNKTETNGTWYLLDTVPPSQMMASFRVPQNKTIMLWIGCMTGGTTATSSTTEETLNF